MCRKMTEKKHCQGERAGPWAQPQGMAHAQKGGHRAEGLGSQAKPEAPAGLDFKEAGFTGLPLVARELPGLSRTSAPLGYCQPSCSSHPHPLHPCTEVSLVLPKTGACADPSDSTPASHCLDSPCFSLFLLPGLSLLLSFS